MGLCHTAELDSAGNMMKRAEMRTRMRVGCVWQVLLSPGTSWKVGVV